MRTQKATLISEFLTEYPLYRKLEVDDSMIMPHFWQNTTFQFFCDIEGGLRTFSVVLEPEEINSAYDTNKVKFQTNDKRIQYIQHISGVCQSCRNFKSHFLINYYSEGPVDLNRHLETFAFNGISRRIQDTDKEYNPKFFLKKIGQFPAYAIKPDKEIYDFLEATDKEYYNKALVSISQGYGIAAYSYFRRIVETEVIRIVQFLIEMELPEKEQIGLAYAEYKTNHQMDKLLIRIDEFLPKELKVIHEYPIRVLYNQLSMGIHSYNEETCLHKAEIIDELLSFIIKGLNNHKNVVNKLSKKMKELERRR
jgi:hypothetical protein